MDVDFLKDKGFDEELIQKISPEDYIVIKNFFNSQEIENLDKNQIISAIKLLSPIFKHVKLVDMFNYVTNKNKDENLNASKSPSDDEQLDKPESSYVNTKNDIPGDDYANKKFIETTKTEESSSYQQYVKNYYIVQQVWVLEYLINNPNLLPSNESLESIKRRLMEKETELKIHNQFLQKFFDTVESIGDIAKVIYFKHFDEIKKDIAIRIQIVKKNSPFNFKGMLDCFHEFGFEDRSELNSQICSVLAGLIKDARLEKLLKFTQDNFKQVNLDAEKKKFLKKIFRAES